MAKLDLVRFDLTVFVPQVAALFRYAYICLLLIVPQPVAQLPKLSQSVILQQVVAKLTATGIPWQIAYSSLCVGLVFVAWSTYVGVQFFERRKIKRIAIENQKILAR